MTHTAFRTRIIIAIFIIIIFFPLINSKIKFIKDFASSENRKMASQPKFDINHLDPYPARYEKYYNDNFTIRSILVKYFNLINILAFKKSPFPDQVIIGNDGWLFLAGSELDSYRGKQRLQQSELEAFKNELEYRQKYMRDRNCKFYFLIAPVKAKIYSEKVPYTIYQFNDQSWGEQLIEYLKVTNSEVRPINVYDVLKANKNNELLYHKLDNHWNQLGAFYAANEILKRIHIDFPRVSTTSLTDYDITKTQINDGNLIRMLSNIGNFKDYSFQLTPKKKFQAFDVPPVGYHCPEWFPYPKEYEIDKEIKGSDKPKILIITDSFGGNIFPFLAEEFSRSVKIFDGWKYRLNEDIIKNEKPDIVLYIALESDIKGILDFQSRPNK